MIDDKAEYQKAFRFCKRWADSPSKPSYLKSYSRGLADREPAKKVYDFICSLQKDKAIGSEERLDSLHQFLMRENEESRQGNFMGSSFYSSLIGYINRSKIDINEGRPVQTRR